jgi:hypothetical protein
LCDVERIGIITDLNYQLKDKIKKKLIRAAGEVLENSGYSGPGVNKKAIQADGSEELFFPALAEWLVFSSELFNYCRLACSLND